ncbi:MAG: undecaprenyldiphospho-muramoylpentapeptide beta-N-acetylglucosaminyltransferase [bacterium]|nr:undecaprenyldiphospho-muramoylpentapeptide beta-N-acetylglucosaminyltransferase [bacterium]
MKEQTKLRVIISGGGTGGHIYPAIAVAQAIQKRLNNQVEILFVGASDRMEMEKVPKAGYAIEGLWISGLQRSLSIKNLLFPVKFLSAVSKSLGIINRFKPDLAIGFGGYASGAMMYASSLKGIPSMIHEQNSYAGITNKILKNRVQKIAVAYDNMERFFPAQKIVKTGNPVRQDIVDFGNKRAEGINFFGLNQSKKTVLVIGGSLGARTINQSIEQDLELLRDANINLIWQTGKLFESSKVAHMPHSFSLKVSPFIYEMDLAYAAADIVISRAGALSIAELAIVAKPVILVPSPNVSEDHQTKNAMALVEKDAAVMVKDIDAKMQLVQTAISILSDEKRQQKLGKNIHAMAITHAADRIVDELLALR